MTTATSLNPTCRRCPGAGLDRLIRAMLPELPEAKTNRFIEQYELKPQEARLLTSEKALANYFEAVLSHSKSPARTVSSWIAGEFLRYLNDLNIDVTSIPVPAEDLARLIDMVTDKTISGNAGKVVLGELFKNGGKPEEIVKEKILPRYRTNLSSRKPSQKFSRTTPRKWNNIWRARKPSCSGSWARSARATKGKADPTVTRELLMKIARRAKKVISFDVKSGCYDCCLPKQPPYLSEVVNRIVQKFHPEKIILFGSWAHGEAREDSDLDLLVVLPKVEHTRMTAIQIGNALSNLPISKDIIVATPEEIEKYGSTVGSILLPAVSEGKVVYESR